MTREIITPAQEPRDSDFRRGLRQIRTSLDAAVAAMERSDAAAIDDVLAARLLVSTLLVALGSG